MTIGKTAVSPDWRELRGEACVANAPNLSGHPCKPPRPAQPRVVFPRAPVRPTPLTRKKEIAMTKSGHKDTGADAGTGADTGADTDTDAGTDTGADTDAGADTAADPAAAPDAGRLNPSPKGPVPLVRGWQLVKRPPVWGGRRPFFTRWGKCNAC